MTSLTTMLTNKLWLFGATVSRIWSEQISSTLNENNNTTLISINHQTISSWSGFVKELHRDLNATQAPIILFSDVSALSHRNIEDIKRIREHNSWFLPVIHVDSPHLAKIIQLLNTDLAGCSSYGDEASELVHLLQTVCNGGLYFSRGFCTLLNLYGFPLEQDCAIKN